MDSFTERMMERAKARKDRLKTQLQNNDNLKLGVRSNISPLKDSTPVFRSHVSPLKESNSGVRSHVSPLKETNFAVRSHLSPLKETNFGVRSHLSPLKETNFGVRSHLSPLKETNFGNVVNISSSPSKVNVDLRSPHKVNVRLSSSKIDAVCRSPHRSDENLPRSPVAMTNDRSPFKIQPDPLSMNRTTSNTRLSPSKTEAKPSVNLTVSFQSPEKDEDSSSEEMDVESDTEGTLVLKEDSTVQSEAISAEEYNHSGAPRNDAKQRLKKLGALYGGRPSRVSSPIQQTEERFAAEEIKMINVKPVARSARLAALASQINQWEDDVKHVPVPTPVEKSVSSKGNDETRTYKHTVTFHSPKKGSPADKTRFSVAPHQFVRSNYQSGGVSSVIQAQKSILKNSPSKEQGAVVSGFRSQSSPVKTGVESRTPERIAWSKPPLNQVRSPMRPEIRTNPLTCYSPTKESPVKSPASPFKANSPRPLNLLSPRSPSKGSPRMGSVLQKAIAYEAATSPSKPVTKDPAELSLAERKALFEKNKGEAILPKVPFGQPLPANNKPTNSPVKNKSTSALAKFLPNPVPTNNKPIAAAATNKPVSAFGKGIQATSTVKGLNLPETKVSASPVESPKVNKLQAKLAMFEQQDKSPAGKKYNDDRQKELEMLRNRWDRFRNIPEEAPKEKENVVSPVKSKPFVTSMQPKTQSSPKPPPMPEPPVHSSSPVRASISPIKKFEAPKEMKPRTSFPSVKPIIVSPPKSGNLYPSLSDIEAETESEAADEENTSTSDRLQENNSESSIVSSDNSMRREIMNAANEKIEASFNRKRRSDSSDLSSNERNVLYTMDDFLDEAMSDDSSGCPSPSKQPRNNFSVPESNSSSNPSLQSTSDDQGKSDRLPLTHTVSFYRKQQNQNSSVHATPVKKFVHQNDVSGLSSNTDSEMELERELVEKKIAELQQRISTEQTVISQATQALNLCFHTVEFSNSTEQVEAERLLLLATHKRQAALNELQRLKIEGTLRPNKADSYYLKDQGSLTISEVTLPIKIEAIRNAAREEMCHHLVCLLKCDDAVFGTSLITAAGKSLQQNSKGTMYVQFPNKIFFPQLFSDFKITLEVYDLVARSKEVLPHDIKYHISSNKKDSHHKLRLTPKKHKPDSRLARPVIQSPAGPSAVRTSTFSMVGYAVFSLREIQRTQFTLNRVSYTSPLEGNVQLKMSCELSPSIEHRGFLTMFEDVSGFGAWHRRWCLLKGDTLSYWKYPDDESTRVPIDTIDLNSCTTKNVNVVSRDICARPNTFLLETIRPAREDDIDSLVLVRHPSYTMMRHLLSADTKEERREWCEILNKALAILRAWGRK